VGVCVELGLADRADSAGSFGWNGLASTYFRVDPSERLVVVAFAQHFPFDEHRLFGRVTNVVWSTLSCNCVQQLGYVFVALRAAYPAIGVNSGAGSGHR
jgi:CubicO group peptidase (beta-lactamase class C family)